MSKFDEKYPLHKIKPYFERLECGIFRVPDTLGKPCACCKDYTVWVDYLWDTDIFTCSEECRIFLWNEFFISYKNMVKRNGNQ